MRRREVKRRLARSLDRLSAYCRETATKQLTAWPAHDLLELVETDVASLSTTKRVSWKTFSRLDRRLSSLRLALRFDNLLNRALARLNENAQGTLKQARPLIQWLVRMHHPIVDHFVAVNRATTLAITKQTRLDQHA